MVLEYVNGGELFDRIVSYQTDILPLVIFYSVFHREDVYVPLLTVLHSKISIIEGYKGEIAGRRSSQAIPAVN